MASDVSKSKAPDGKPWPPPRIAVDNREQRGFAFGHVPAPWLQEGERGPVHLGQLDAGSLVTTMLDGPWQTERATLAEGDYQLLGPDGLPIYGACVIERKSAQDLRGSLSAGHTRLMAEMARMAPWSTPVLIVEAPVEALLGARSGLVVALEAARVFLVGVGNTWDVAFGQPSVEIADAVAHLGDVLGHQSEERTRPGRVTTQSLLGSLLSIITDHRIPTLLLPSRAWAEYAAAWILRRSWRRWLIDHPEGLAAERARLAGLPTCSFCMGSGEPCSCNDGIPRAPATATG